jgi:hypothetical protein
MEELHFAPIAAFMQMPLCCLFCCIANRFVAKPWRGPRPKMSEVHRSPGQ